MSMPEAERSLEAVARLRESAHASAARLVAREEAMARLRNQIAMLKASMNPPAPAPTTVRVAAPVPAPRSAPVVKDSPKANHYAAYAAIAACALLLEVAGARRPAREVLDLAGLVRPAAAPVTHAKPAAKGAPVVVDDDRSTEALMLVHEWKLPGDEKSLGERLGRELELPGGRPSWSVERTGAHGYRVTFQPGEKDLPYSFEADIESRVVWPTPETQEILAPRFTAAFRDAVR